ncbi:hypothetical protein MHZ93_19830 [Roseomonas sp. ACRSG]|nr:hypothetical protein [Roseomonas sp. ACRSG]
MPPESLARQVKLLFEKFDSVVGGQNFTLYDAWERVFSTQGSNASSILANLATVDEALDRLVQQISSSTSLDEEGKLTAYAAVKALKDLTQISNMHAGTHGFKDRYSRERLGILTLLGGNLAKEFPQGRLSDDEAAQLTSEIDRIVERIETSSFPVHLKDLLKQHCSTLRWAIQHAHILGSQAVYDAAGKAVVTAHRAAGTVPEADEDARSIVNGVVSVCAQAENVLSAGERLHTIGRRAYSLYESVSALLPGSGS